MGKSKKRQKKVRQTAADPRQGDKGIKMCAGILAGAAVLGGAAFFIIQKDYTMEIPGADGAVYTYTGQKNLRTGRMHGEGTLTLADGTAVSGTWEEGKLLPDAELTFPNGSRYVGSLDEETYRPKGTGTFYYKDPERPPMDGENWTWVIDKPLNDGEHNIKTKRKMFYTGTWLDSQRSGYGSQYNMNADSEVINRWTGEFRKANMYGEILKTWKDYAEWTLQFDLDGEEDGDPDDTTFSHENVTFRYLSADCAPLSGTYRFITEEELTEGIFAGLGKVTGGTEINGELVSGTIHFKVGEDADGNAIYSEYDGTFSGDEIVGKGEYWYTDGTVLSLDKVSWLTEQTTPSGGKYTGMLVGNEYTGYGVFHPKNGGVYQGEFRESQYSGTGMMTYATGNTYTGDWSDGSRSNGHGIYTAYYENKNVEWRYHGDYKDGHFHDTDADYTRYYENGNVELEYHGGYIDDIRNDDDATYFAYYEDGTKQIEYRGGYKDGVKDDDYADYSYFHEDGTISIEYHGGYKDGEFHDTDADYIRYYENGNVEWEYHGGYIDDMRNDDDATYFAYYEDGTKQIEYRGGYKDGVKDDDYADYFYFYEDGTISVEYHGGYKDGEMSDDDAVWIKYYEDGTESIKYHGGFKNSNWDDTDADYIDYDIYGNINFTYTGSYVDDKRNGEGTYTDYFDNGMLHFTYKGNFKDNNRDGTGTLTFATGDSYYSEHWEDGYIAKPDEAEFQRNTDVLGGASLVEYKISINGKELLPYGVYTVGGGEMIRVEAYSESGIEAIHYQFGEIQEGAIDAPAVDLKIPDISTGTEIVLDIQAVANGNTDYTLKNLITKTGWLPIKLVYNH